MDLIDYWEAKMRPITALSLILSLLCFISAETAAQEVVSFASLDGQANGAAATMLPRWLFKPTGAGPLPAVLAMHGCGGLFNRMGKLVGRESAWADLLIDRGYVVLFPDSFGPRKITGACGNGEPGARPWVERTEDAYGALDYLQAQPFVMADRV